MAEKATRSRGFMGRPAGWGGKGQLRSISRPALAASPATATTARRRPPPAGRSEAPIRRETGEIERLLAGGRRAAGSGRQVQHCRLRGRLGRFRRRISTGIDTQVSCCGATSPAPSSYGVTCWQQNRMLVSLARGLCRGKCRYRIARELPASLETLALQASRRSVAQQTHAPSIDRGFALFTCLFGPFRRILPMSEGVPAFQTMELHVWGSNEKGH